MKKLFLIQKKFYQTVISLLIFWTKQLEKEYRDDYKKGCLEMIELQNKQKENYKRLIEAFHEKNSQKRNVKDFNVIINVPKRLINND